MVYNLEKFKELMWQKTECMWRGELYRILKIMTIILKIMMHQVGTGAIERGVFIAQFGFLWIWKYCYCLRALHFFFFSISYII